MLEPPTHVTDRDVLRTVRSGWDPEVATVEHLPVGFGAHHWRACVDGRPRWFVTFDSVGERHSAASLDAAYGAASELAASGLEFVHACRPTTTGATTVPLADGALSVTDWLDGPRVGDGPPPDDAAARATGSMLRRLHAAPAPPGIPRWKPLIDARLVDDLATRTSAPWTSGPYGEPARRALVRRLGEIERWTASYHRLAARAHDRAWVATHGEPHTRNQVRVATGTVLVDWESLRLAPAERDLRALTDAGFGDLVAAEPAMLELFDLEWRLDEISQYAAWFEGPHDEGPDARTAFDGLVHELVRELGRD